jgi:hypothetical protein
MCAGCVDSEGVKVSGGAWWFVSAVLVVGGCSVSGGGMRDGDGREAAEW